MKPLIQALLFDVDGTLADTEKEGHLVASNRAFSERGLDWHWSSEFYTDLLTVTGGKERLLHYIKNYHPNFSQPNDLLAFIANIHQLKQTHYLAILKSGKLPLRPGVKRLIKEARAHHIPMGIATTTSIESVLLLLETCISKEAPSWFEVIAAGDMVAAKKPAADVYQYCLDKLSVDPKRCFAFEDSENGIKSALAAKIPTIITSNDYTQHHNFTGALLHLNHLGEPDKPFTVKSGAPITSSYVNIELLNALQRKSLCDY